MKCHFAGKTTLAPIGANVSLNVSEIKANILFKGLDLLRTVRVYLMCDCYLQLFVESLTCWYKKSIKKDFRKGHI